MKQGVREEALKWGFHIIAEIGVALGGDEVAPHDLLTRKWNSLEALGGSSTTLKAELSFLGQWQDVHVPLVQLVNQLDVDIVISSSNYESSLGLVRAFINSGKLPKALALSCGMGDPNLYRDLDKNVRWLSGASISC